MDNRSREYVVKGREILTKITSLGGESYIIGECVFKIINALDVDNITIYTNLVENKLIDGFNENKLEKVSDGKFILTYLGFEYIIETDKSIKNNEFKTIESKKHYSNLLIMKIVEMDYSIYSIAMNQKNVIYDIFYGKKDIEKKLIKSNYINIKKYLDKNPLKILDAIRVVSETGYRLDGKLLNAIYCKRKRIKKLSLEEISSMMMKIFKGKFFKKALKVLVKTKVYKYLPYFQSTIKRMYNSYRKESYKFFFGYEMIRRKTYVEEIGKHTENEHDFKMFVNLAITNQEGNYDKLTLFTYGLNDCLLANRINYLLRNSKKKYRQIKEEYNALPIKKTCDLAFKGEDLLKCAKLTPFEISAVLDDVIYQILECKMKNERNVLESYIMDKINNPNNDLIDDKEKITEENITNTNQYSKQYSNGINDYSLFQELKQKQEEFNKRLLELEIKSLEGELENEVLRKLQNSNILMNVVESEKEKIRESLYQEYYNFLLQTEKYKKLREFKEGNSI